MSSNHARTVILSERYVDGTLKIELPHFGGNLSGQHLDAAAFNFVKTLSEDLGSNSLRLPSLPEVAIKIRRALVDDHSDATYVARIVGSDPVLAARIIGAANSAYCGQSGKPVCDLQTALFRLGLDAVYSLAMTAALEQVLHARVPDELRDRMKKEWEHSTLVAALAQSLARLETALNPDEAFLTGLLHGVGRLYILRRAKDHPELLGRPQALRFVMDAWHHAVGFALIAHWGLSPEIGEAVRDYGEYDTDAAPPPTLTTVVHLADQLAHAVAERGKGGALEFPRCRALNVPDRSWQSIVTSVEKDLEHLHHVLGV
jgi:HD-like signal output (HDOD) protein